MKTGSTFGLAGNFFKRRLARPSASLEISSREDWLDLRPRWKFLQEKTGSTFGLAGNFFKRRLARPSASPDFR